MLLADMRLPSTFFVLRIPTLRELVAYSVIGAATIGGFSYKVARSRNEENNTNPSNAIHTLSFDDNQQQQQENFKRFPFMKIRKMFNQLIFQRHSNSTEVGSSHPLVSDEVNLCQMALSGIDINPYIKPEVIFKGTLTEADIDELLAQTFIFKELYIIYDHFKKNYPNWPQIYDVKFWNNRREKKLAKFLNGLHLQIQISTETIANQMLAQLPSLLVNIIDRYRIKNKQIVLASLKIMADIVPSSRESAEMVIHSDWLQLLASMLKKPVYDEERILAHKIIVNLLNCLGAEETMLSPHLYELHRPTGSQTPKLDIIFVHGLRGSVFRTWRQLDQNLGEKTTSTMFWPKDWLANDLEKPIRILALDYASYFLRSREPLESIGARAKRFQMEFDKAGVGQRPVLFICHSMGGLLIKQMLFDDPQLLTNTLGVLFMATPHKGSPLALERAPDFIMAEDVRFLRTSSQLNRILDDNFKQIADKIPLVWTVLECELTPLLLRGRPVTEAMMVPIESAIFGRGPVYHLKAQHHHVCKPESREAAIYAIVYNFVSDALFHLSKK